MSTKHAFSRRDVLRGSLYGGLGIAANGLMGASSALAKDEQAVLALPSVAHAMWVHGHSMQIEFPDRIPEVRRAGFYIHIRGTSNTTNWFHFAVPTPVLVDDKRLRVGSVMVVFTTGSNIAQVTNVHVYDGDRIIVAHDGLNLSGKIGFRRFDVPAHPQAQLGIGISIGVRFLSEPDSQPKDYLMDFVAAGCDFLPPLP
jgi:hypothetical protein